MTVLLRISSYGWTQQHGHVHGGLRRAAAGLQHVYVAGGRPCVGGLVPHGQQTAQLCTASQIRSDIQDLFQQPAVKDDRAKEAVQKQIQYNSHNTFKTYCLRQRLEELEQQHSH